MGRQGVNPVLPIPHRNGKATLVDHFAIQRPRPIHGRGVAAQGANGEKNKDIEDAGIARHWHILLKKQSSIMPPFSRLWL